MADVYADESNISATKSSSPMVEKVAESTEVEVVEVINVADNLVLLEDVEYGTNNEGNGSEDEVSSGSEPEYADALNASVETLVPTSERNNEATASLAENLNLRVICLAFATVFAMQPGSRKRHLTLDLKKQLKQAISQTSEFAQNIVKEKKQELKDKSSLETVDLLSRIMNSGHSNDAFVIDMVISFIIAGRDTTSAALTWFFWLISCNFHVEKEILNEFMMENPKGSMYDEVKDMVYTHVSLYMRKHETIPTSPCRHKRGSR
ncbi:hypothetical protein IFM89_028606 [Coptis chinensis]|uniref:Cytochrome P450 n=1 Tax=Coptis chinensis TaxID=261450 RepID=A0A835IDT2_9MAGN|nr:hypothetical protein IFM89_028606 [Coptis chinensis]